MTVDLRPIPYERVPVTPLPDVWESNSESAWLAFDAAVMAREVNSPDARAALLWQMGEKACR